MIPLWPRAATAVLDRAVLKAVPEDFQVFELPAELPCGDGEHLWLEIRKRGLGTPQVADWLAASFGVPRAAVGYAGMKDTRAVTEQWFSVHTPRAASVLTERPGLQVLAAVRHRRKLKRGELAGNRFRVRLTGVAGDAWPERLQRVCECGAPNYFGAQRFGRDNLSAARAWLPRRRQRRLGAFRAGLYRSVLRSFLFNEVLAARVAGGSWREPLPGDVAVPLPGARARSVPTGPLWGRGRSPTAAAALAVERAALAPHQAICDGLEHAGVRQERRPLLLLPGSLRWEARGDTVDLAFELPAGSYATALLAEVFEFDRAAGAAA